MSWLKSLFSGRDKGEAKSSQHSVDAPFEGDERFFEESFDKRTAFWAGVGTLESDLLAHLISPGLMGGAAWPTTRQAYRVVRRSDRTVLATDGMSDPFDGVQGMGNGFEIELFVEAPGLPGDVAGMGSTWAYAVLAQVAGTVADAGGINGMLEKYGVLSMELPGASRSPQVVSQLPASYITDDDAVGILIGAPKPDFAGLIEDMPLSPVVIAPVVLLTAAELTYLRSGGPTERAELAARLASSPSGHVCDLSRPSLI